MVTLEDLVQSVVEDFVNSGELFTALDVSNEVKKTLPATRHKETREVVRSLFVSFIEPAGWSKTPITVHLANGDSAEALLYHPLSDSWDLDNKYNDQKRSSTAVKPSVPGVNVTTPPVAVSSVNVAAPAVSVTDPMTLWQNLFANKPSLFPKL